MDYYKAVDVRGLDFYTGTVIWIPEGGIPVGGHVVRHARDGERITPEDAATYLSVSTVATDCIGMLWPCRLLKVEPAGREVRKAGDSLPHKRCSTAWRVVEEVDATLALGSQGAEVVALIDQIAQLTPEQLEALKATRAAPWATARAAAWDAARDTARDTAWDAAWDAVRDAARIAARVAVWGAASSPIWQATDAILATLVRDLISDDHYHSLMGPWNTVMAAA